MHGFRKLLHDPIRISIDFDCSKHSTPMMSVAVPTHIEANFSRKAARASWTMPSFQMADRIGFHIRFSVPFHLARVDLRNIPSEFSLSWYSVLRRLRPRPRQAPGPVYLSYWPCTEDFHFANGFRSFSYHVTIACASSRQAS